MGIIIDSIRNQLTNFLAIILGSICLFVSMFFDDIWYVIAVPIVICGVPIIVGAVKGVVFERDITADVLVSIAIVASVLISEYEAAAEIAIIMQIGAFLEEATVDHANSCIRSLNGLRPSVARVIEDGKERTVPAGSLQDGQVIRILPGEIIPSDGVIVSGDSSLDTSIITGEPVPKDVSAGDRVTSGMMNMYGAIDIEIHMEEGGNTFDRMMKLIEDADAGRSKIVRTADRWAVYIVVIALTVSVFTYMFTRDIQRSVTVLVVFCPCALILATPTAIMAASANLSRHGILVKDGGALERLSKVDTILVDKTGTLTTGRMECLSFVSFSDEIDTDEMSRCICSLEGRSEHPIGKAIAAARDDRMDVGSFEYIPGKGVSGTVGGRRYYAGNRSFIGSVCPDGHDDVIARSLELEEAGFSLVFIGCDGRTIGYAVLSDTIREDSHYMIRHMRMLRLKSIMITGDSRSSAIRINDTVGLDDLVWECLPSDKLRIVSNIDRDGRACMVGDGINDAPSLKRASVGISVCNMRNDIAMESSDIVLLNDDLRKLPGLVTMSRRTLRTIKAGILFSIALNTLAMVMAVMGMLGPVEGAIVHNVGSVIVIVSAVMLLRFDPWRPGRHASAKRDRQCVLSV